MTDQKADYGPPEAAQHAPRVKEETEQAGVYRLRVRDFIDQWHEGGLIDSVHRTAADAFIRDMQDCGMEMSCEKHERVDGSKQTEPSARYLHARENLTKLAQQMSEIQYFCLYYVVGLGHSPEEASRRYSYRGRLPRSKDTIRKRAIEGLEIAAIYYRLAS